MLQRRLILCLSAVAACLWTGAAQSAGGCVPDWGAAGDIVRREGLLTIEQVSRMSPQQLKGQIIQATLCESGGGYVYRLVVRDPSGAMRNVELSAANREAVARVP